jgi:hypothetical protein
MISEISEISVLKNASEFHDKVEQDFQQRDLKVQVCNYGSLFFCGSKMRLAITFCGHILWRKSEPRTLR